MVVFVAFDKNVIESVEEGNLKVSSGVILRTGFEVIGFEHDIPQLQHGFDGNIIVKVAASTAVDFLDDLGQLLVVFR